MAKKLYEEANIQAIADAIREKNGMTTTYLVSEMAAAILALSGGSSSGGGSETEITGVIFPPVDGWQESKLTSSSSYSLGSCSFSEDGFTGSAASSQCAGMISPLTDFSGKNTLHIEFSASIPSGKGQFCVYVGPNQYNSGSVVDKVASAEEIAAGAMDIDVSAVSGEYYLIAGVMVWGGGATASCTITKISLEV